MLYTPVSFNYISLFSARLYIYISLLSTPVCSLCQYALNASMLSTPVCYQRQYALYASMLSTPVCSQRQYALYACLLSTSVCSLHQSALYTCLVSTPDDFYTSLLCKVFALICSLHLFPFLPSLLPSLVSCVAQSAPLTT